MEVLETEGGLRLTGRLDSRTIPDVRLALHRAVDAGSGDLRLDVAGLEIWDAAGLGLLVGVHRRALHRGRRVLLVDPSSRLLRLMRLVRLQRVLLVADAGTPSSAAALG